MNVDLVPMRSDDREQIIDIFNHYVENTFAAYPEQKVPYEFFDMLLNLSQGYPTATARDAQGNVIGLLEIKDILRVIFGELKEKTIPEE